MDLSSDFLQALVAPYHPPNQLVVSPSPPPRPDHAARCRATVNWSPAQPSHSSSHPPSSSEHPSPLDQPIYQPHGRWAWTHGLSIDDPKQQLSLRKGAQCSASIDSGSVAGKEIKYICRRWKTSKQKEWHGFYSELALYKSEQYLRPLQGDVVPHIIGVHIMPEAVSITMEMPHSSFWIESSPTMPHALKERVIVAFEKIHAQGVLHGDPELRHMLIGADGKAMIIDFGMSRAIREHASLGIERAEPEEFRLEMRKVKYKLDYMGARKKEGDKVDDYLRRIRRNRKISELWKRRAKGERVGPIPQYAEDPEEYELDPPVNAQDFQQDWIPAADDSPLRVVVPGQAPEEVARQVQALVKKLEEICNNLPTGNHGYGQQLSRIDKRENIKDKLLPDCSRAKDETDPQLRRARKARRVKRREPIQISELGNATQRWEDEQLPLSAKHIEATSRRRDHIRYKHLRNTCISSLSSDPNTTPAFPGSIEVPEKPKSLRAEECRRIQESGRQAMLQYSRAPKGILKRGRDEDEALVDAGAGRPCKKLRFSQQPAPKPQSSRAFGELRGGRRTRIVHSRPVTVRTARQELIDFTLPSLRTLSVIVGSLMSWACSQS